MDCSASFHFTIAVDCYEYSALSNELLEWLAHTLLTDEGNENLQTLTEDARTDKLNTI